MKKAIYLIGLSLLAGCVVACKKTNEATPQQPAPTAINYAGYTQLSYYDYDTIRVYPTRVDGKVYGQWELWYNVTPNSLGYTYRYYSGNFLYKGSAVNVSGGLVHIYEAKYALNDTTHNLYNLVPTYKKY